LINENGKNKNIPETIIKTTKIFVGNFVISKMDLKSIINTI
jgi:hypothetical protein